MTQNQYKSISCQHEAAVTWLRIERADVLNALDQTVLEELTHAIDHLPANTRALVLCSSGDKAFVAGADIASMSKMTAEQANTFAELGQNLTAKIEGLAAVTIARVQGFALGGGCELAMACDLIIASEKAKFGQPEVNLGLIPGFGGTQRLIHRLGPIGLDILLTGRVIDAQTALQFGLVSRVVADDLLDKEIERAIAGLKKAAPQAIAATKKLAQIARHTDMQSGLKKEREAFAGCFKGTEAKEGMNAFLEKRPAEFSNH